MSFRTQSPQAPGGAHTTLFQFPSRAGPALSPYPGCIPGIWWTQPGDQRMCCVLQAVLSGLRGGDWRRQEVVLQALSPPVPLEDVALVPEVKEDIVSCLIERSVMEFSHLGPA